MKDQEILELRKKVKRLERERYTLLERAQKAEGDLSELNQALPKIYLEMQAKGIEEFFTEYYHRDLCANGIRMWANKQIEKLREQSKVIEQPLLNNMPECEQ